MNISYNWLKDLVETGLTAEEVAAELTRIGLAVEGIHAHGDDFVLDIDLTSNRPDCLSHLGVAREMAVGQELAVASGNSDAQNGADPRLVSIVDPDLCHRFTARVIHGVKIGPSPLWLADRLEAIGERSINNVADITNYVMHELGQPMHSFDLDRLAEGRIVVRRAKVGETLKTLDEVDRKLDETMLAICDAQKPVAIGGVMGGLDSCITDSTVNVLLEVAYFSRANIRRTSRKLNLVTEASYRFERGVDIENLVRASNRAAELICELAGGKLGDLIDVYPTKFAAKSIESVDISAAVKRLTGLDVATEKCVHILNALGIASEGTSYIPPSWRHDIAIEEDLVEEVARHAGYENIANELPPAYGAGEYQPTEHREKLLRQTLVAMGFDEAISYSFIDTIHDEAFENVPGLLDAAVEEEYVTLQDSVIEGAVRMRPSLLPGLLDAIRLNLNYQRRDLKLFEVGKVFGSQAGEDNLPNERELFSLVLTGGETLQNRAMSLRDFDFYDAKGAVEAALNAIGVGESSFEPREIKHLRRGQSAVIEIGGITVGSIGRLSDEIAAGYKFKQPVFVAELNLKVALDQPNEQRAYAPLAKYPAITRDVSFVAKRGVSFAEIRSTAALQKFELCRRVSFVDVFEGKGLADDERSVTIRLEYRSDECTLIESEVEAMHQEIVAAIERKTGVKQRF
jgi:phenylalanyl-tRNA synthetase beta chain